MNQKNPAITTLLLWTLGAALVDGGQRSPKPAWSAVADGFASVIDKYPDGPEARQARILLDDMQ
jgi:hypothetical protein